MNMKNKSRIVLVGILALLAVITVPSALAAQGDFYLEPQHSTGSAGSDTYVLVKIDTTADMMGYQTDIYFDPAIVNITNVDFSDSPWGGGMASWTWYSGHINFIEIAATTKSASTYTLANLTLRGMDAGTSDVDFSDAKLSDPDGNPLTSSTENGTYTAVVGGIHDINVSTDYSSPTGIRIKEVGGADIPHGANLTIGTEYGVMTEVKNEGDFDETAVYETIKSINETGAIVFEEPTSEKTINVSESKDFEKTWNISGLTPGFYTVFVNASIVGSVDDKPENNNRTREVRLEMSGVYGVELTVDKTEETTTTNVNATYTLTVNNTGTDEDTFELIVENADDAAVANLSENQVTLASGETRTVLLNVTDESANGYRVNVTARSQGNTSVFDYVNTTTTVSPIVVYGVNLTVDKPAETTATNVNATYTLTVNNMGTVEDTFHLTVDNADNAAVADLSEYQVTLASGENATVLLNVTDETANGYRVNATAVSQGNTSVFDCVNTTTTVITPVVHGVELTADKTEESTTTSVNATYTLTVNNTGTDTDTFDLIVDNADNAAVADLSEYQVTLTSGETQTVLLNVTDETANGYRVNVTAISQGNTSVFDYVNTTTTVVFWTVNITDFWIENTPANRGQSFKARLNLTTTAAAEEGWYVIVVSGTGPESEGIAGTGTMDLTPGSVVNNIPVLVQIPAVAKIGPYDLIASVYTHDEYQFPLDSPIAYKGPRTATVQ
ncbi:MAG: hypothetical protein WBC40_03685 [Halobacteriota archaeon]